LAEYFIDMDQLEAAATLREKLRRFRGNVSALVALAQIANARNESAAQTDAMAKLESSLASNADRALPWDRRVSLAILLAQARQLDRARTHTQRCMGEITETKMRWLTTNSLFRFHALAKIFELQISDPPLRTLALERLPPGRQRLAGPQ
jgi:hypothetical protein